MNAPVTIENGAATKALAEWNNNYPHLAQRGIDESTWNALKTSVFPGASDDSVILAVDYCRARGLDVLMKPVHIVPMYVQDKQTGQKGMRDVIMPGVGMYRIQADRSGDYAGAEEPEFGEEVTQEFRNKDGGTTSVTYPKWCKYTVYKQIGEKLVKFIAKEYWIENYATESRDSESPNAMWKKRPFAQLAKCTEAQALRKGWPEIGQDATAEEMQGKEYIQPKDVTPTTEAIQAVSVSYPQEDFDKNYPKWEQIISSGRKSHGDIIAMIESKGALTNEMKAQINSIKVGE